MKKVLLVEDDPGISDVYSMQFKKEGYDADIANTVEMALEKLKNNHPDLLVLDLNLHANIPGPKDGLDVLKFISQNSSLKNLSIIVVSNYDQKEYSELSSLAQYGVKKYFLKVQTLPEELTSAAKELLI